MKTIQKPKRIWQKKKDYNKKRLVRKIQRRNKTSFDGGKDESYSDLKTNRPIIIGPGLLSVITPNPEKYKKGKDCFDIGTNDTVTVQPNVFINNDTGEYTFEQDEQSFPLEVYDKADTDDRSLWTYKLPDGRLVTPHKYGKLLDGGGKSKSSVGKTEKMKLL